MNAKPYFDFLNAQRAERKVPPVMFCSATKEAAGKMYNDRVQTSKIIHDEIIIDKTIHEELHKQAFDALYKEQTAYTATDEWSTITRDEILEQIVEAFDKLHHRVREPNNSLGEINCTVNGHKGVAWLCRK